jgi:hypothetical protein
LYFFFIAVSRLLNDSSFCSFRPFVIDKSFLGRLRHDIRFFFTPAA